MSDIKNIVFDFDNTIAQTIASIEAEVLSIVKKFHLNCDDECILKIIRKATNDYQICKALVPPNNIAEVYQQILRLNFESSKSLYYHPALIEALHLLSTDYNLHIVSGRDCRSLLFSLHSYNIDTLFDDIIGGDSGFMPKPSAATLNYLINKWNIQPSQLIMIGDAKCDYKMAINAHCKFIQACWYEKSFVSNNTIECTQISEIIQLIKKY